MHANGAHSTVTSMVRDGDGLHLAAQTNRATAFNPTATAPVNGAIPLASYLVRFDESFAITRLQAVGTGLDGAGLDNLRRRLVPVLGLRIGLPAVRERAERRDRHDAGHRRIGPAAGFLACASPTRIVWATSTGRSSAAALAGDGTIVAVGTFEQTVTINAGTPSALTFTHPGFGRTSLLLRFAP